MDTVTNTSAHDVDGILETESGKRFLTILESTGKTTKAKIFENTYNSSEFVAEYNAWMKKNQPAPTMPDIKKDIKVPCNLIRVQHKGRAWLVINYHDGTTEGVLNTTIYGTQTDPRTGEKRITNNVKKVMHDYTIPWDIKTVKKYIKDAQELSDASQHYTMKYKSGDRYIIVDTEKEFLTP